MLMKFIRQYTIHTKADIRKMKKRKDNINVLLFLQALGCYNQFVFVGKEIYLNRKKHRHDASESRGNCRRWTSAAVASGKSINWLDTADVYEIRF